MTEDELREIEARAKVATCKADIESVYPAVCAVVFEDIPALVAEVRRLREGLARLERGDAIWGVCAVCEYDVPRGGHQPGCPLAAILADESQLDGQKP